MALQRGSQLHGIIHLKIFHKTAFFKAKQEYNNQYLINIFNIPKNVLNICLLLIHKANLSLFLEMKALNVTQVLIEHRRVPERWLFC